MPLKPHLIKNENEIIYVFDDYRDWDHNIHAAAQIFKEQTGHCPNIMLANEATLNAIDLYMSKKLLEEGRIAELKKLTQFKSKDFTLQVCISYELGNHQFMLVFDSEATFGED